MTIPTTNGVAAANDRAQAAKQQVSDRFGTRAIHVGSEPSTETAAVIPSISLSTTYAQAGVGNHKGFEYSRSDNPNRSALEAQLASLEGGTYALAFSSGSAATATILNTLQGGGHVLSVNDVYGGTYRYLKRVAEAVAGVRTTFVDLERVFEGMEKLDSYWEKDTKIVWIETPTNPTLRLIDVQAVADTAHARGAVVVVDNTFLSPYYQNPLLLGADIVVHSLSKYINGHSDVIMGAAITNTPALADKLRFLQNAIGAVPSPFDCWLAQRGAKTLHLRAREHGLNALRLARVLSTIGVQRGWVVNVVYPGLSTHPRNALAWTQLSARAREDWPEERIAREGGFAYGGMVSVRVAGGKAEAFLEHLRLFTLAESLGGVESLAELPSKMTHASLSVEDRATLGIGEDLVRLSVGIEDGEDLKRDVLGALEKAFGEGEGK